MDGDTLEIIAECLTRFKVFDRTAAEGESR
jgi:hypothetical protein